MRDFNGNRISGIVNINDSSQYGRPLETLSYEELVAEEAFRLKQWQQERSVRWKRSCCYLQFQAHSRQRPTSLTSSGEAGSP